ncbi:hypothetical protein LN429_15215 [Pseudomonas syringae]|uniref:hypothetical protein n=1 Tax=Pseudomonas syringae TaxID=317 RepID=UPI00234D9461|nr:hypothetical protein [Pseudomonas syringae]MDC6536452.1 hypothetical protein [Pseudomonas syringae]
MEILQDDLFAKAKSALRDGTAVIEQVGNCRKLAPSQRERLINGITRLSDRIAISTRLAIEARHAGDAGCLAAARAILGRHLSLAGESLPAIAKRITEGSVHA